MHFAISCMVLFSVSCEMAIGQANPDAIQVTNYSALVLNVAVVIVRVLAVLNFLILVPRFFITGSIGWILLAIVMSFAMGVLTPWLLEFIFDPNASGAPQADSSLQRILGSDSSWLWMSSMALVVALGVRIWKQLLTVEEGDHDTHYATSSPLRPAARSSMEGTPSIVDPTSDAEGQRAAELVAVDRSAERGEAAIKNHRKIVL